MKNHTKMFQYITYKTLIGAKPLRIRFNNVDAFIRFYDGTRSLVLFDPEKYYAIYNRIRYFICQKKYHYTCFSYNYVRMKVNSYNFLSLENKLTF